MKSTRRRTFLRGAAGAALALPFLPSLAGRARAGTEPEPRRIVFVYVQQQESEDYVAKRPGRDFTLSGTYLEPLAAYRARTMVVHGLRGTHGHAGGHSEVLTGWPGVDDSWRPLGGPSLDQLLGRRIGATPLPTLGLTLGDGGSGRDDQETSWRRVGASDAESTSGEVVAVPHIRSPRAAFELVFGPSEGPSPDADRQLRSRRSLLDALVEDYDALAPRLAPSDRRVVDAHLTLLREHEQRLAMAPLSCEGGGAHPPAEVPRQESARLHCDAIVGAFRCDVTRVATLAFAASGDESYYSWLGVSQFHEVAHMNPDYTRDPRGDFAKVRRWQSAQVAYLLDRLADVPDPEGGTLLDSTTVVWVPELGSYSFASAGNNHLRTEVPAMVIGDCGGALDTGVVIDAAGASYHRFLLTLVHAMGFPDVARFGRDGDSPIASMMRA